VPQRSLKRLGLRRTQLNVSLGSKLWHTVFIPEIDFQTRSGFNHETQLLCIKAAR
jgi:hypothetical protein